MDENNEKIDNNNPLSVRVDTQYKDIFNNLIKEKGISKKQLMESMIFSYLQDDTKKSREENISFSNEISLISNSLNDIFSIFKTVSAKSQDTIGSMKDFHEQEIKNLKTRIETFEISLSQAEEKNRTIEVANNSYAMEKESLLKTIDECKQKITYDEAEISKVNKKNQELLEQINTLRLIEKTNHTLSAENEKLNSDISSYSNVLKDKNFEIEALSKKIQYMEETIKEFKEHKSDEIKEIEQKILKEADLDKKMELLQMQSRINELQVENAKSIGIINQKAEEILILKNELNKVDDKKA